MNQCQICRCCRSLGQFFVTSRALRISQFNQAHDLDPTRVRKLERVVNYLRIETAGCLLVKSAWVVVIEGRSGIEG